MTATDPAHRHGGPGAGWYRTTTQGWQPITGTEAANERYEDMRHFMTDPREADNGSPTPPLTGPYHRCTDACEFLYHPMDRQ